MSIFRKSSKNFQVSLTSDKNKDALRVDLCTYIYGISLTFNISFPENYAVYKLEICGRAAQATDENVIWRMRFACWITKATNTPSEYVILIALQPQHWLRERASVLRYSALPVVLSLSSNFDELRHPYDFACAPTADVRLLVM